MKCWACGTEVKFSEYVPQHEVCEKCAQYLHCCKNCEFYNERATQECEIPEIEFIAEKDKANYCDDFKPAGTGHVRRKTETEKFARDKFNDLFH